MIPARSVQGETLQDPPGSEALPQYIFFSKGKLPGDPHPWDQHRPETFTAESLEEVVATVGTRGNDRIRIGALYNFSILEGETTVLARSIERLQAAAEAADVPVFFVLDGQNWWQTREDLWNWWDPSLKGYDPANRMNVEWTDWGMEHAIKISWRNWGRQIRVRPAQNIFAPRVLAEYRNRYDVCVPIIARWYRSLPAERRWLFGGVKVGWEASTNVNAYYYPNGNTLFERYPDDPSHDPQERDKAQGWTFGLPPLGHAAATCSGVKESGTLTKEDTEEVIRRYLALLAKEVRRRGIPPHLIFTHQGGNYAPWEKHLSFSPAMNENSIPGWSIYSHDPQECGTLAGEMEAAGRQQWGAVEWWRGGATAEDWRERFTRTLEFKQCRLIGVYNWPPFRKDEAALAGLRGVVERYGGQVGSATTAGP